jgi:hypothetical protein
MFTFLHKADGSVDRAKVSHIQREPSGQFSDLET